MNFSSEVELMSYLLSIGAIDIEHDYNEVWFWYNDRNYVISIGSINEDDDIEDIISVSVELSPCCGKKLDETRVCNLCKENC